MKRILCIFGIHTRHTFRPYDHRRFVRCCTRCNWQKSRPVGSMW